MTPNIHPDKIEKRKKDIERINNLINECHRKLKPSSAFSDNGMQREFYGTILQIAIADFDIIDATNPDKMHGYSGFSQYIALRPIILKIYEIGKALTIWANKLLEISEKVGHENGNEIINLFRKKNRPALRNLDKLAKIRNSASHATSDNPSSFIKDIENFDLGILYGLLAAVIDCITALLFEAMAMAEKVNSYRPPSDRSAAVS